VKGGETSEERKGEGGKERGIREIEARSGAWTR